MDGNEISARGSRFASESTHRRMSRFTGRKSTSRSNATVYWTDAAGGSELGTIPVSRNRRCVAIAARITIPTVWREDCLGALRALNRYDDPGAFQITSLLPLFPL